ncbi:hypothetical protein PV328_009136 [Microctonus aethiopoides]|uniref:Uncharacterized protein n=1 Tax=Microctonus aethiopoides TaxID=144406 RepID=A0AA39KRT6_9HYME|nr:hypothetical protein PV328_009136 [Microctonus aethiopoides]
MISKNEVTDQSDETRVKIISEKRQSLDKSVKKVRTEVTNYFEEIINCLKIREKQLLRQIEVVHNQQLSIAQSNWEFFCSVPPITINLDTECNNLKQLIDKLGKIELSDNTTIVDKYAEPYRVEEYEDANHDHISFDKSIQVIEKDNDNIIKLFNLSNSDKKIIHSTNVSATPINISFPSSSSNSSFDTSLKHRTNKLYLDSSVQKKIITKTQNNNCSPMCSLLKNVCSQLTKHESQMLDIPNNGNISDLCSSKFNMKNNSSNEIDNNEIKTFFADKVKIMSNDNTCINTKNFVNFNKNIDCSSHIEEQSNEEHPKQIQQWLQQILVETETEPSIQENEQFAEISKSRYHRDFEFSLET